ncbi:hypothetical protein BDV59DRAFT_189075 [Aspergillus ambiguus]|uniref:uncharacterized protein n=1 Tax=Aspergillus ambiguus TaxID=176160 RepID=UPI003CCE096C
MIQGHPWLPAVRNRGTHPCGGIPKPYREVTGKNTSLSKPYPPNIIVRTPVPALGALWLPSVRPRALCSSRRSKGSPGRSRPGRDRPSTRAVTKIRRFGPSQATRFIPINPLPDDAGHPGSLPACHQHHPIDLIVSMISTIPRDRYTQEVDARCVPDTSACQSLLHHPHSRRPSPNPGHVSFPFVSGVATVSISAPKPCQNSPRQDYHLEG